MRVIYVDWNVNTLFFNVTYDFSHKVPDFTS